MTERETTRLIAWSHEMRRVHARLREALDIARDAAEDADPATRTGMQDLLLYCRGFCLALDRHHRGEDATLFPAIAAAHPELGEVLRSLERDHSMIGHLLGSLQAEVDDSASPSEVLTHLEGIGAVMETHFRYEERQLLGVLESLGLDASPREVLGPL